MDSTATAPASKMLTRRGIVQSSVVGGLAMLARGARAPGAQPIIPEPGPLRFVHMTDVHACGYGRAPDGLTAALASIAALAPAPDFVITGGDHIMDAFTCDAAHARAQWDVYGRAIDKSGRLPIYPVIGNHDVWGWGNATAGSTSAPEYGKAMALDRLKLARPYYSFDRGGWHFICLDNVAPRDGRYYGALDPAQLEWLKDDLRQAGHTTPICIVTHIPLLSACVFFDPGTSRAVGYTVRDSDMHHDVQSLLAVLRPEGSPYNIRLLLSGHIHLLDRIEYRGMTFICGGAVCGNWWQGGWQGCEPGYGVVDLWPDGQFAHQYVPYEDPAAAAAVTARHDLNVLTAAR